MTRKWYEELYDHFETYQDEPYVQNTEAEVDFIERMMDANVQMSILDVGCGTGRHSLELARRGYPVTGVDLSETMLAQGRSRAEAEDISITFIQADARELPFNQIFDAAIMLCEGGFSLMEEDEMDILILKRTYQALKPDGKLIMTAPNAVFMLCQETGSDFDPLTHRETFTLDKVLPDGRTRTLHCTQRYYTCPELRQMLADTGFQLVRFFACTPSGYKIDQKPKKSHFEFGALAVK